ncbi:PREDICTED: uncharacterized protein LOC109230996 isoform X2 [Nicotiana attenuata]|uniref:uncharacterized protein LOC109230996 isoform X2 n=1 Tax=Nicotiana attenuata TaxID=49451 RepID=UPI0009048C3A|nr:PREDICTED: uncharacterized protein LOC109230996 isoform X2 [Nicotiana attenuata]
MYIFKRDIRIRYVPILCFPNVGTPCYIVLPLDVRPWTFKMNQFKKGPDFAAASIGHSGSALSPWTSQGVGETNRGHSTSEIYKDSPPNKKVHVHTKKQKRRKSKGTSSPNSSSSSSSKSSRAAKSRAKFVEGTVKPANIEVA